MPPLADRRVLVTRPAAQAKPLCDALRAAGAIPIAVPAIRVVPSGNLEPLDAALDALSRYDWLVFTSVNGVAVFLDRLIARGGWTPFLDQAHPRVAAVGSATAGALRAAGIEPACVPTVSDAEHVVEAMPEVTGARVLWVHGILAEQTVVTGLRARGAEVEDVVVYGTEPALTPADLTTALHPPADAITFASGSAVRAWTTAGGGDTRQIAAAGVVCCIGRKTADVAAQAGLPVHLVAREQSDHGMVDALITHFTRGESRSRALV